MNVIVTEVKQDQESAVESQHNEQMVGLWRERQRLMLGFEFSGHSVRPKVLARENATLHMYYMDNLNIMEGRDFGTLVKLMIAFLVLVEYRL